jgi:hypothetical protein
MWWKRKKLERLLDELRAIALLNRLDALQTDLMQNDPHARSKRETRQLELLAEMTRLQASHSTRRGGTAHSTVPRHPRAA